MWNYYPVWFADPSMFVNLAILLILFSIPWSNPDIWCWMYSKKTFDGGNHLPIFLIPSSSNNANFIAHNPPARCEWVPILSSGIFLMGSPNISAANFIWKVISLYVSSPLPTLSQYSHKSAVPLVVCTRICVIHLVSAFTGHSNIFPSM